MVRLLGPAEIRALAADLDMRPTKKLGQNFVHDPNTVRRIVGLAGMGPGDRVLEVGPGLGSLTFGLLETGAPVEAVEVDPVLAARLPQTAGEYAPDAVGRLRVHRADALRLTADDLPSGADAPNLLVANLPYNVAVPVVLHLLADLPSLRRGLVMVQTEVADRMVAGPGSRIYGVPSVKMAWYCTATKVAAVPRTVFWPVPNVDSALVSFTRDRRRPPLPDAGAVFAVVDAAFAQRRKTLRAALASLAGSAAAAEKLLRAADVDPSARGEQLTVDDFARIAAAR